MFLALMRMFAEGFLHFLANYLGKIYPFVLAFFQVMLVSMSAPSCISCTPIPFDRSAIGIKMTRVMGIMGFVQPSMFLV